MPPIDRRIEILMQAILSSNIDLIITKNEIVDEASILMTSSISSHKCYDDYSIAILINLITTACVRGPKEDINIETT